MSFVVAEAMEWRTCPTCPLEDNTWPATDFYPGMARCKACYTAQKRLAAELKGLADTEEERAKIRKQRGICQECPNAVDGVVGKTLRCAACRKRTRYAAEQKRRRHADARAKRSARRRELHAERMKDPEYAEEYRRRRQRERSINHPGYQKLRALDRKWNANPERQEKKRQQAKARYYENNPVRPDPHCTTCGSSIDWKPGRGRPPKYHQTAECNPYFRRHDEGQAA